ncbi:hypothetical protein SFUMM280S_08089 [Streptomyces fumanus]
MFPQRSRTAVGPGFRPVRTGGVLIEGRTQPVEHGTVLLGRLPLAGGEFAQQDQGPWFPATYFQHPEAGAGGEDEFVAPAEPGPRRERTRRAVADQIAYRAPGPPPLSGRALTGPARRRVRPGSGRGAAGRPPRTTTPRYAGSRRSPEARQAAYGRSRPSPRRSALSNSDQWKAPSSAVR